MGQLKPHHNIYSPDYVMRKFDALRDAAIQEFTQFVSRWSVYSVDFLNAVAELQGVENRLPPEVVPLLRTGQMRIDEPRLVALMREARDAQSMKIAEIVNLISACASKSRVH